MNILEEGNKDNINVVFTMNDVPLQVFKRFKTFAKDWRDNYSVTLQVLMDKADTLEYIMSREEDLRIEEIEYEDEVQTLGRDE